MTKTTTTITLRVTQTGADKQVAEQLLNIAGGKTNAFSVVKGQKYALNVPEGSASQAVAVMAKKSGQNLVLKLADGTEVVAKNFYSECGADACSMSLSAAGGDPVVLAAEDAVGSTLSDGSQLMYAHGDAAALKMIAQNDEALLSSLANAGNQGVVTYWPQSAAGGTTGWMNVLGGLGLAGLAAGAAGGGSDATPTTNLDIKLVAGPVVAGHGLVVTVYDAQGKAIGNGTAGPDGSVRISIDGNYAGVVLVRVSDGSAGPDYLDEASGTPADMTADLRAMLVVNQGGTYTVNVNPLTELAVRGLGLTGGDSGSSITSPAGVSAEQVKQANEKVATNMGLSQELVTGAPPVAIVDTTGGINPAANTYGKLLAALSGADQNTGSTDATLNALVDALEKPDASPEVSVLLINGAKALEQPGIASDVVQGLDGSTTQSPYAAAYANILAGADGVPGNNSFTSAPVLADFQVLGISGITQADVALLNSVIDANASDAVDSLSKLAALAATVHKLTSFVADEASPSFTAQELTALGLTGITEQHLSLKLDRIKTALSGQSLTDLNQLNTAAVTPTTLVLDGDSGVTSSGGVTNKTLVKVGALEEGASFEYSLDGGNTWSAAKGVAFNLPEGVYASNAVQVRQKDSDGKFSQPLKLAAITVDTSAPITPTLALEADTGSSTSDRITTNGQINVGAVELGGSWQYTTDGGTSWATGTGSSFTLAAASYEADAVQVRQIDAAGNTGPANKLAAITVDSTAPSAITVELAADTGSSAIDRITSNGQINVSGVELGGMWQYTTNAGTSWTAGEGSSFTLASASYAADAVQVRQVDAAGNTGPANKLAAITVDTTSPSTPTVTLAADTGGSASDRITTNGQINVGAVESGGSWQYTTTGGDLWTTGTGSSFTLEAAKYSADAVQVRQIDAAGNTGSANKLAAITVDSTAPSAITVELTADTGSSAIDRITSNGQINVSGVELGGMWQYTTNAGTSWTNGTGSSFTLASASYVADAVQVRQVDAAGNTGPANKLAAITVDTTSPSTLTVTLEADTGSTTSDRVTSNGQINVGAVESGGSWQYTTTGGDLWTTGTGSSFTLEAAKYSADAVQVRQIDAAGNTGSANKLAAITVDSTAPSAVDATLAFDTGSSGKDRVTSNGLVNVTGLETGGNVQYTKDGGENWITVSGGATSFTLTEGSYASDAVQVRQLDAAGNMGEAIKLAAIKVDATAPSAPLVNLAKDTGSSDSDLITSLAELSVTGVEEGAKLQYSLDQTDWSFTVPTTTAGSNTVWVRQIDVAGNVSVGQKLVFTKDTVVLAPTLSLQEDTGQTANNTDLVTRNAQINVASLESGASWAYQVDGEGEWIAGTGTSFDATEGEHSYVVRQTDVAGNSASSEAFSVTLVSAADSVTVQMIDSTNAVVASGITNDSDAKLKVTADEGDLVQYRFITPDNLDGSWTDLTGSSLINVDEGTHSIQTRIIDNAGNFASTLTRVSKDTTAATPTMTLVEDTGNATDKVTTNPMVVVANYEGGAKWEVKIDDSPYWNPSTEGPNKFRLELGTHTYQIRQTDKAGNVSEIGEYTFTYQSEIAQPTLNLTQDTGSSANDGITSASTMTVSGLLDGATWAYRVDGGEWLTGEGTTFALKNDGASHSYAVRQQLAGKWSEPTTVSGIQLDTAAPAGITVALLTDSGASATDNITNVADVTVSGLELGARLEWRMDGGQWQGVQISKTSETLSLESGTHAYDFRQVDAAGNVSQLVTRSYTYLNADMAAPTMALASDTGVLGDGVTSVAKINVTKAVDGNGVTWQYEVDNSGTWVDGTEAFFNATDGAHDYRVRQVDVAGNISPTSDTLSVNLDLSAPNANTYNGNVKVADIDRERAQLVGVDKVLTTVLASDQMGVTYAIADNDYLKINASTGEVTFKQPTGYKLDGNNVYAANVTVTDVAGNVSNRNFNVELTPANNGAPTIDVGAFRTGEMWAGGGTGGVFAFSDGSVFLGSSFSMSRVDQARKVLATFAMPASEWSRVGVVIDAQDRLYYAYSSTQDKGQTSETGFFTKLRIIRYTADGAIDTSYGTNGTAIIDAPSGQAFIGAVYTQTGHAIDIGSNGRLVLGLSVAPDASGNIDSSKVNTAVLELSAAGQLVSTATLNANTTAYEKPVHVAAAGSNITYVATAQPPTKIYKLVNGVVDGTFNNNIGFVNTSNQANSWGISEGQLKALDNGDFITIETAGTNLNIRKYKANGTLDASFASSGQLLMNMGAGTTFDASFDLDPASGKIYAVVAAAAADYTVAIHPSGSLVSDFANNGILAMPKSGSSGTGARTSGVLHRVDFVNGKLYIYGDGNGTVAGGTVRAVDLATESLYDNFGEPSTTAAEGTRAIGLLTQRSLISDADYIDSNYNGTKITLHRLNASNGFGDDVLGARGDLVLSEQGAMLWKGTEIGTFTNSNGKLEMTFNANATQTVLNEAMRTITYRNSNQLAASSQISLRWTITDSDPAGAKTSTFDQVVNLKNDNSDIGDSILVGVANNQTLSFDKYFKIGDKTYYSTYASYVNTAIGKRTDLDNFFNAGENTSDDARTAVLESGIQIKLLTQAEFEAVYSVTSNSTLNSIKSQASYTASVFSTKDTNFATASEGTSVDSHVVYDLKTNSFKTLTDAQAMSANTYVLVEVIASPEPPPAIIDPSIKLVVDNGESQTDRLTSDGRLLVAGLNPALSFDYSFDGGLTWQTQVAGASIITAPEGTYAVGDIQAKQTDPSGFTDVVKSTGLVKVDKTIKSLGLQNDQGLSLTDNISADGSIAINGLDPERPYEYSTDNGVTWTTGGTLANGAFGFVLNQGSYATGAVRIRQTDVNNLVSGARNVAAIQVDALLGQGQITLVNDNGADKKDGISSDDRMQVTGLRANVAFEFSTNAGSTWTSVAAVNSTKATFVVQEGSYSPNDILVKQADGNGFMTTVGNRTAFSVDKTAKTVVLLNDQGVSASDNTTADGRIIVKGFDSNRAYEYSTNGGSTWAAGSKVNNDLIVTLTDGVYGAGKIKVRQTAANGLTTEVASETTFNISAIVGQGAVTIGTDTGRGTTDALTSDNRFKVTGLRDSIDYQYSLDNGATWNNGTRTTGTAQTVVLPDGSYAAGQIHVKQTDAAGYVTTVKNAAAAVVDTSIAKVSVTLLSDNGVNTTDGVTSDGRVHFDLTGTLAADDVWQYSLDGGTNWAQGVGTSQTITLENGQYKAGNIRVQIADAAGNMSTAAINTVVGVVEADTTAPVFTSSNIGYAVDRDGTGTAKTVANTLPLLTVATNEVNAVSYSLSGTDAALFNISEAGQITFKTATNQVNSSVDNYSLVVAAMDAFGNTSSQNVTLKVVGAFAKTGQTVDNWYTTLEGKGYEVSFSHDVKLLTTGSITLKSPWGAFADKVLDLNDATQVKVEGNKLIILTGAINDLGSFEVIFDKAVASSITNEVWKQPAWSGMGFQLDKAVTYDEGKLNPAGSLVVSGLDGATKSGMVSVLGDVNGDGLDDWAMTAPEADANGRADSGKIYVVYGRTDGAKPDLTTVANGNGGFVISGANNGDLAGMSVSSAGDFNGDGLQDIAIHANGANGGNGKGYVVFGSQSSGNIQLASVEGNASLGRVYTNSVKDAFNGVGDINGDGYDDIAHGQVDLNRVTTLDEIKVSYVTGERKAQIVVKADWLSFAANWVDAASKVAAFFDDPLAATIETAVDWEDNLELVMGGEDGELDQVEQAILDVVTKVKNELQPNQTLTDFDLTQSGGGGGGLFSAPKDTIYNLNFTIESKLTNITRWTTTLYGAGETVIEYGGPNGGLKKIIGTINGQQVGSDAVSLGDINGDGRADFGVLDTGSGGVLAKMNVVYGTKSTADLFTNNFDAGVGGFRITDSSRTAEYVGEGNFTGLGDVNGDGLSDFAITLDSVWAATYVVYGKAGMTSVDLSQVAAGNGGFKLADAGRYSNVFVDAIGDFNGDGLDDFAYYGVKNGATQVYNMYVVFGGATAPSVGTFRVDDLNKSGRGFVIEGQTPLNSFAINNAVSSGDINGDGLTDLLVRGASGETVALMGSSDSGKFSQINVDVMGTSGNDNLTSTGSKLIVGGLGNDTITTAGADVVMAGAGDDRIIMDASTTLALQNTLGTGGNTTQLAKIDAGAGIDTLQLSGGANLDFRFVSNKMMDLDNISGRVSGIEKFDLATDAAANKLTFGLNDVLEMGTNNAFNTTKGWLNVSGTELSSLVAKAQLAVTAGSNDRVELRSSEWTATGAVVREQATNEEYYVYQAKDAVAAQLLIDKDAVFGWV